MYTIETERLGLRLWRKEDILPFIAMNQDPQVMEFFTAHLSPEESVKMLKRIKRHFLEHGFGLWAVEVKDIAPFIGFVGLSVPRFTVPQFQTACTTHVEIGWRLGHEYWGKGFAQEAARACLDYGFNQLRLPEIISFTSVLNTKSENVMKKIGMNFVKEFDHPNIPEGHRLSRHVLYLKENSA